MATRFLNHKMVWNHLRTWHRLKIPFFHHKNKCWTLFKAHAWERL